MDDVFNRHNTYRSESYYKHQQQMPRFAVFLTTAAHHSAYYRHVNVVELRAGTKRLPATIRSREVKQVLLRTIPMRIDGELDPGTPGPAIRVFERAERIIAKLDNMTLSLQAADLEGPVAVKNLFDHLWKLEQDDDDTAEKAQAHA